MKNSITLLLALFFTINIYGQGFTWNNVPIGGGGFLTGIVTHLSQKNLIYARTDVGGIYKYQPAENEEEHSSWKQLLNWIPTEDLRLWGCDGIGLNPGNVNEVYALLGSNSYDPEPHGLYKSDDQGKTWRQIYNTICRANENNRWIGEPIAVQPLDGGKVVIVGTRLEGIIRSADGGVTWKKISSIVPDPNGMGVRCVVFDPQTPTSVYAVDSYNVYRSTDSGLTFEKILGNGSMEMRQAVVNAKGQLFVTTDGGIYSAQSGSIPTKLSTFTPTHDINAIAVDFNNANHLIVAEQNGGANNRIYRTTDAGIIWKEIARNSIVKNNVPWYEHRHFAAALASLKMDPYYPNRIWFTDWFLPWKSDDVSLEKPVFESVPWGVEELVIFDIVSPTNAPLLYQGCADNGGFTHYSLTDYPTVWYDNQESTGIDFCENHPEHVVRVSSLDWGKLNFRISLSEDCGRTWKTVGGNISTTGKMAYSSKNINNFVFAPTGQNQTLKYTLDGGATPMKESQGIPAFNLNSNFWDNWNRFVVSDRINGNKFYVVLPGKFYVSTDGGANFKITNTSLPGQSGIPAYYLTASPYEEGVIWLSTGQSGLRYSRDSGKTFKKVGPFSSTKSVSVGPPLFGNIPIVYVYGKLDKSWGVYMSQDNGLSWERINSESMQISNNPRQMSADRNRPGRVYIGTGGVGILYGECELPADKTVPPVISPAGGVVDTSDEIWITSPDKNDAIYYTLDGSIPTEQSQRYLNPIKAENATIVKAIAISPGKTVSDFSVVTYTKTTTNIKETSQNTSVSIYPVPVEDLLTVTGTENKGMIYLRDLKGALIYKQDVNDRIIQIPFFKYGKGLYLLTYSNGIETYSGKLIKK